VRVALEVAEDPSRVESLRFDRRFLTGDPGDRELSWFSLRVGGNSAATTGSAPVLWYRSVGNRSAVEKLAINRLIASENIDSFGSFPPPVPGALNRKRRMAPLEGRIHFSFVADLIIFSQGLSARICDFPGVGKSQGTFAGPVF
jgi:hypothetical protein